VNCEEAKVLIGGDPGAVPTELHGHLRSCRDCREFRALVLTFETRLRSALELQMPVRTPGEPRRAQRWRLGIGIAAALLAGFALWVSRPPATLAAEVVNHIEQEPESWVQTRPVSVAAVDSILPENSGFVLSAVMALAPVVYASRCDFRGHRVAHFVVMTESGPVTLMVLSHERVRVAERFESDGYWGILVPVSGGSIALVSHSDIALEKTMSEVMRGIDVVSNRSPHSPSLRD
jgi:Protein of unknown function (DUF3379)